LSVCVSYRVVTLFDAIRDAVLTCAQKLTRVMQLSLPHETEN